MRTKNFNEYIVEDNITKIKIKHKEKFLWVYIDTEDLSTLVAFSHRWYGKRVRKDGKIYAQTNVYENGHHKTIMMHQIILKSNVGMVDHIDNNSLNNRKENLRLTDNSNNLKNRKARNKNNTSGYRNVTRMGNYWRVQLQIGGKNNIFPEKFEDVHEAGKFAEQMRNKYYGNFAGRNGEN